MARSFPSLVNPTIHEIYLEIIAGRLILSPGFQRSFVWTQHHQEEFLDTLLRGLPCPEFFVYRGPDPERKEPTIQHVVDGQQRLSTIVCYIEGEFDRPLKRTPDFASLHDIQRQRFMGYRLAIRDLGELDDDEVREIFRRVNLTRFKLDGVEIQHAVYNGAFIATAKAVLKKASFDAQGVFGETELSRMGDLHFMLMVMAALQRGYGARDDEVEDCIKDFNEEFEAGPLVEDLLIRTLENIDQLGLPVDSLWWRKTNYFTLVVEVARHHGEMPEAARHRLETLETRILAARATPDTLFGRYYGHMHAGTQSRRARIVRAQILNHHLYEEALPDDLATLKI